MCAVERKEHLFTMFVILNLEYGSTSQQHACLGNTKNVVVALCSFMVQLESAHYDTVFVSLSFRGLFVTVPRISHHRVAPLMKRQSLRRLRLVSR